jgi:hypothetical protein
MADVDARVSLAQLAALLRERAGRLEARNLILVALPLATAHRDAPALAERSGAHYLDFDAELIKQLEQDNWARHLALEARGTLFPAQDVARKWLAQVFMPAAGLIRRDRPLLIGNLNLAVKYQIDVAKALYDATQHGLCVIAAGGQLHGQTLLVHGVQPQTGATAPAYEVIPLTFGAADHEPPNSVQDRLI